MIRIDRKAAERVMREEAKLSESDAGDEGWISHIEELSRLCEAAGVRTHVAFLGAALLAKSLEPRADLKWIKPKHAVDAPFAFSIRPLSENVLVPVAAEFGIHLGVTGAQPLNNQPYFRMSYLGDATPISGAGRAPFNYVLRLVDELGGMDERQSRAALRAFVTVRRRFQPRYREQDGRANITLLAFASAISGFVEADSEGGKRAQACVAAVFDVAYGPDSVISERINDPSRDKPGDVCVVSNGVPYKAVEVKDKPVAFVDVQIFGKKSVDMRVADAAYVMVAGRQERLDGAALERWATEFGLSLRLFYEWHELVTEALYWSPVAVNEAVGTAVERVRERLVGVEARPESVAEWIDRIEDLQAAK